MNSQELVAQELPSITNLDRPMSVGEVLRQGQIIHQILTEAMVEGIHYGSIPGTGNKKTLLQPGAEKICTTFRLAPKARVEDLSEPDANRYRYRIAVGLYTIKDGLFVGEAVGEASSDEEKYQWEASVCDEHWDATDPDHRRIKYKKATNDAGFETIKQVRRNAADLSNTVLKIAYKRAFVSSARGATAASDLLEVDMDEPAVAELVKEEQGEQQTQHVAKPKAKAKPAPSIPFGKHKGLQITDEAVPLDYLEWLGDRTSTTLKEITADPKHKRAKFKAQDQLFLAAIDAEIARRKKAPEDPKPGDGAADAPASTTQTAQVDGRKPFTESGWADMVLWFEEEATAHYATAKKDKQVTSAHEILDPVKRLEFYDYVMVLVNPPAQETKK